MAVTNKNISDYDKRREIATKAFEGGFVIFVPTSQKWYTPREFLDSNEQVIYTKAGVSDVPNVNFYYPAYAIKKRIEKLQTEENDFKDFVDRVNLAFEMVPRKKPTKSDQKTKNNKLIFSDNFRGKQSTFRISEIIGSGGSWFLYINNYYFGQLSIIKSGWVFKPQNEDVFSDDQKEMILNRINKFHPVNATI